MWDHSLDWLRRYHAGYSGVSAGDPDHSSEATVAGAEWRRREISGHYDSAGKTLMLQVIKTIMCFFHYLPEDFVLILRKEKFTRAFFSGVSSCFMCSWDLGDVLYQLTVLARVMEIFSF